MQGFRSFSPRLLLAPPPSLLCLYHPSLISNCLRQVPPPCQPSPLGGGCSNDSDYDDADDNIAGDDDGDDDDDDDQTVPVFLSEVISASSAIRRRCPPSPTPPSTECTAHGPDCARRTCWFTTPRTPPRSRLLLVLFQFSSRTRNISRTPPFPSFLPSPHPPIPDRRYRRATLT